MKIENYKIYSDGGANPNPGKAGYGVVILDESGNVIDELSKGYNISTNNRMEMLGVISGLKYLDKKLNYLEKTENIISKKLKIKIFTDSQYTINGIEKGWAKKWKSNNWLRTKTEKAINYDLWEILLDLVAKHDVSFKWVKGHSGDKYNERCDELATIGIKSDIKTCDEGFEKLYLNKNDINLNINLNLNLDSDLDNKKTNNKTISINKNIKSKIGENGGICKKCDIEVIKKIPKMKKLKPNQQYYYGYYFHCENCKSNYMIPEGKIYV